jgi:hypothetical protein
MLRRKIIRHVWQHEAGYESSWACPLCEHTWKIKPPPLTKCRCGAVVDAHGWVERDSQLMPADTKKIKVVVDHDKS